MNEPNQDFGWALNQLRQGLAVQRKGWNGVGMWLHLQVPSTEKNRARWHPDGSSRMGLPYIYINVCGDGASSELVPWTASQTDVLATDWTTRSEKSALPQGHG